MNTIESPRGLSIQYESMPLPSIPLERGHSSWEETAGHELNHALVALHLGATVTEILVIPQGDILGVTRIAGSASKEAFQAIAMAGSVHTHKGDALGYGSDVSKAYYLQYNGGNSIDSARNTAASIISQYPNEVRKKAAEIIAYLGKVSGSLLPLIIQRAYREALMEKESIPQLKKSQSIPKQKGYTEIISLDTGDIIIRVVDEKEEKEDLVCSLCLGINGHFQTCLKNQDSAKGRKSQNV